MCNVSDKTEHALIRALSFGVVSSGKKDFILILKAIINYILSRTFVLPKTSKVQFLPVWQSTFTLFLGFCFYPFSP